MSQLFALLVCYGVEAVIYKVTSLPDHEAQPESLQALQEQPEALAHDLATQVSQLSALLVRYGDKAVIDKVPSLQDHQAQPESLQA